MFDYHLGNLRTGNVADKGEFHFRFSHRFSSNIFDQSGRDFDLFGLDSFRFSRYRRQVMDSPTVSP